MAGYYCGSGIISTIGTEAGEGQQCASLSTVFFGTVVDVMYIPIYSPPTLYVLEQSTNRLRYIDFEFEIQRFTIFSYTHPGGLEGLTNGDVYTSMLRQPRSITTDAAFSWIYIADQGNYVIRRIYVPHDIIYTYAGVTGKGIDHTKPTYNLQYTQTVFGTLGQIVMHRSSSIYACQNVNQTVAEVIRIDSVAVTVVLPLLTRCEGITLVGGYMMVSEENRVALYTRNGNIVLQQTYTIESPTFLRWDCGRSLVYVSSSSQVFRLSFTEMYVYPEIGTGNRGDGALGYYDRFQFPLKAPLGVDRVAQYIFVAGNYNFRVISLSLSAAAPSMSRCSVDFTKTKTRTPSETYRGTKSLSPSLGNESYSRSTSVDVRSHDKTPSRSISKRRTYDEKNKTFTKTRTYTHTRTKPRRKPNETRTMTFTHSIKETKSIFPEEAARVILVSVVAATISSALLGSGAMIISKLSSQVITGYAMACGGGDVFDVIELVHPTQVVIGTDPSREVSGAVVFDFLYCSVPLVGYYMFDRFVVWKFHWERRWPGVSWTPTLFFYLALAFCSVRVVYYAKHEWWQNLIGGFGMLATVAMGLISYFGRTRSPRWVMLYGSYHERFMWFATAEFVWMTLYGTVAAGIHTTPWWCDTQMITLGSLHGVHFITVVILRPFSVMRDFGVTVLMDAVNITAIVLWYGLGEVAAAFDVYMYGDVAVVAIAIIVTTPVALQMLSTWIKEYIQERANMDSFMNSQLTRENHNLTYIANQVGSTGELSPRNAGNLGRTTRLELFRKRAELKGTSIQGSGENDQVLSDDPDTEVASNASTRNAEQTAALISELEDLQHSLIPGSPTNDAMIEMDVKRSSSPRFGSTSREEVATEELDREAIVQQLIADMRARQGGGVLFPFNVGIGHENSRPIFMRRGFDTL